MSEKVLPCLPFASTVSGGSVPSAAGDRAVFTNASAQRIVGGESGAGTRSMDLAWARDVRDQCVDANIPLFFKQIGGQRNKQEHDEAILDNKRWTKYPETRVSLVASTHG